MGFKLGSVLKGAAVGFATGGPAGAAAGAIGGALDAHQDMAAYKWQQKQNIGLWNMQNEYNNPKAQMQRYIDAGLNPNLIYSQQNTAGDIAGASQTLGSTNTTNEMIGAAGAKAQRMQQYQQLLNMETSRQQTEAQIAALQNDVQIKNSLLPYQQALLKAQVSSINNQQTAGILGRYLGNGNVPNFGGFFDRVNSNLNAWSEKHPLLSKIVFGFGDSN